MFPTLDLEYFKERFHAGSEIVELENPIKVHMHTINDHHFDFVIKYVWNKMVGFAVWDGGCCCCTADIGCEMTMPDGKVIKSTSYQQFIDDVVNWHDEHFNKYSAPDDVFEDI